MPANAVLDIVCENCESRALPTPPNTPEEPQHSFTLSRGKHGQADGVCQHRYVRLSCHYV